MRFLTQSVAKTCLLFVVGCGTMVGPVQYQTRHGLRISATEGIWPSQTKIEYGTDIFIRLMVASNPDIYTRPMIEAFLQAEKPHVRYHEGKLPCPTPARPHRSCLGYTDLTNIDLLYYECEAWSSLAHELIHWIRYRVEGVVDRAHEDLRYFHKAESVDQRWTQLMLPAFPCDDVETNAY